VITGVTGTYNITDAEEGRFVVTYDHPDYKVKKVLGVWLCDQEITKDVCLDPVCYLQSLCGRVVSYVAGAPLPNITVKLYQSGCGDTLIATETTDLQGYYVFSSLSSANNYKVKVEQSGCTAYPTDYSNLVIPKTAYESRNFTVMCP